jgi:ribosomal protein L12E/L44/L45/RPP1/RPP2
VDDIFFKPEIVSLQAKQDELDRFVFATLAAPATAEINTSSAAAAATAATAAAAAREEEEEGAAEGEWELEEDDFDQQVRHPHHSY